MFYFIIIDGINKQVLNPKKKGVGDNQSVKCHSVRLNTHGHKLDQKFTNKSNKFLSWLKTIIYLDHFISSTLKRVIQFGYIGMKLTLGLKKPPAEYRLGSMHD